MTSVTPTCSNDSAAVEVVARSYDDIRSEDRHHVSLLIRIDYICIGDDGEQVSDNLQRWGGAMKFIKSRGVNDRFQRRFNACLIHPAWEKLILLIKYYLVTSDPTL